MSVKIYSMKIKNEKMSRNGISIIDFYLGTHGVHKKSMAHDDGYVIFTVESTPESMEKAKKLPVISEYLKEVVELR